MLALPRNVAMINTELHSLTPSCRKLWEKLSSILMTQTLIPTVGQVKKQVQHEKLWTETGVLPCFF